jgi:hypothetical protein
MRRVQLCTRATARVCVHSGVAVSRDGLVWQRGRGAVAGERGAGAAQDVGAALRPNTDWWWMDTCHLSISDVQVREAMRQ